MTYQFPTDERFRKLAAKLADAVQLAVWIGVEVRANGFSRCPLGCLPGVPNPRPGGYRAAYWWGCTLDEALTFIEAFDTGKPLANPSDETIHFHFLGLAYRARFVE